MLLIYYARIKNKRARQAKENVQKKNKPRTRNKARHEERTITGKSWRNSRFIARKILHVAVAGRRLTCDALVYTLLSSSGNFIAHKRLQSVVRTFRVNLYICSSPVACATAKCMRKITEMNYVHPLRMIENLINKCVCVVAWSQPKWSKNSEN